MDARTVHHTSRRSPGTRFITHHGLYEFDTCDGASRDGENETLDISFQVIGRVLVTSGQLRAHVNRGNTEPGESAKAAAQEKTNCINLLARII